MQRQDILSYDKKRLSVLEWTDVSDPRGSIQLIHSKAEHAERYSKFAQYLNGRGYIVYAMDLRGHGKTDPDKQGYASSDIWTDTLKDLAFVAKDYSLRYPKLRCACFGHGYGAFLAQGFAIRFKKFIDALILSAPYSIDNLYVNRLICALSHKFKGENHKSKLINRIIDGKNYGVFDNISNDDEYVKEYAQDVQSGFQISNGFYKSYFKGIMNSFKNENLDLISSELPILIVCGDEDTSGKKGRAARKLKKVFSDLGIKKVEINIYKGSKRDYLNDVSREESSSDIASFLDASLR